MFSPKNWMGLFCKCKSILYINERKREGLGTFCPVIFRLPLRNSAIKVKNSLSSNHLQQGYVTLCNTLPR